jgi:hypothetical protein
MKRSTALLGALSAGLALAAASATQASALREPSGPARASAAVAEAAPAAAFMMPTRDVLLVGERTKALVYGTRPTASAPVGDGAIDRALDVSTEPQTGGRLTALLRGSDPCPPLLAVCRVTVAVIGSSPASLLPDASDEIFDLDR